MDPRRWASTTLPSACGNSGVASISIRSRSVPIVVASRPMPADSAHEKRRWSSGIE